MHVCLYIYYFRKEEVSAEAVKSLYGTSRKTEVDLSKSNKNAASLPSFDDIINYVYSQAEDRLKQGVKDDKNLAFDVKVYTEVLIYLRLCMIQHLNVPLNREIIKHPCDVSPIIKKFLIELHDKSRSDSSNTLTKYVTLVQKLMLYSPGMIFKFRYIFLIVISNITGAESMCCMLEVVGCVPDMHRILSENLQWLRDLLSSVNETIREFASLLYSIIISNTYNNDDFEKVINYLKLQCESKNLEAQHGGILTIGNCIERRIVLKKYDYQYFDNPLTKSAINAMGNDFQNCYMIIFNLS